MGAVEEDGRTVDDDPVMLEDILALLGALLGTLMGVARRRDIFLKTNYIKRKKEKKQEYKIN